MDKRDLFFNAIKTEMAVPLATAHGDSVTMRVVSPVYDRGAVLIFTDPQTRKYRQLRENPHACLAAGGCFAECDVAFLGATMSDGNRALRDVYNRKFPGAFDEGVAFGGRDAEFLRLTPRRLTGWAYPDDAPDAEGIPTIPFEIVLE